jgi:hypothetical protein
MFFCLVQQHPGAAVFRTRRISESGGRPWERPVKPLGAFQELPGAGVDTSKGDGTRLVADGAGRQVRFPNLR